MITITEELEAELGRRVRAVRLSRGLSQVELGRQANVSVGALKHLESGAGATVRTLMRALQALDETSWLEALRPPAPAFSPLEVLRAQQAGAPRQQRVRRRKAG